MALAVIYCINRFAIQLKETSKFKKGFADFNGISWFHMQPYEMGKSRAQRVNGFNGFRWP